MMHALPLTYGKDMQEDKEPLFDAIDTSSSASRRRRGCSPGSSFDRERLEDASGDEMLAATEVADLLVRNGVPFREAHGIVGGLVRDAVERGKPLSELTPEELAERPRAPRRAPTTRCCSASSWLESKRIAAAAPARPGSPQQMARPRDARRGQARVPSDDGREASGSRPRRSSTAPSTTSPAS